jgi:hypothetical protein
MGLVIYAVFVLTVSLIAIAATIVWSGRFAPRWGVVPGAEVDLGGGAYRSQRIRRPVLVGTPPLVSWTTGIGLVWSVLTTLVLAPILLCVGATTEGAGLASVLSGVGLVVIASSGFFLGMSLACVTYFVIRRDRDVVDVAEAAVVWSVLHHLGGMLFVMLHALASSGPALLILTAPIWVFGLAHAYALEDAAHATLDGPPPADEITGAEATG